MTSRPRTVPLAGATVLAGLSALHLAWAAGSAWPARSRSELSAVMAGRSEVPSPVACVVVATGLAGAAGLVGGVGGDRPVARLARAALAAGFLVRGVAGLSGNTRLLVPWTPAPRFVRLDRRYYGPLCLAIAASAARSGLGAGSRHSSKAE
jgi:Protein of unknown function (DUF3995)